MSDKNSAPSTHAGYIPSPNIPKDRLPKLEGKTILITGGAGFIGSSLVAYFRAHHPGARIIVLDKFRDGTFFPSGNPSSLGHFKNLIGFDGDILALDINDGLEMLEALHFDYVFHEAAVSDTTLENQKLMIKTNHHAFLELLHITLKKGARMIYASSAGTYGNTPAPNRIGFGEEPENIYGFSKLAMDNSVRKILANEPSAPIIGLRYFNVYGAREYYKGKTASMILQLGLQALESKKVKLFEFGEQRRDFVYIDDVVAANVLAMSAPKGGIYNVGSGVSRSFNDIIAILQKELSALAKAKNLADLGDFELEYIKNPYSFFQTHTQADLSLSKAELGYESAFSLEEGIKAYIPEIYRIYENLKARGK
ncbi:MULTISPECIES: ADP-glyceromanno-heptose 6-epimerase [unclassified Helicobacter]|uniref:ADP-glyceromanno-heptose 6-epimerase n=1 Tax=unclassified Helicobacter TaxID=2593540 RepID=UPI0009EED00E|nr:MULTISPECIES: ADP-glyceromanno-heptose 6-epimerase [unclassified Helicobacter]